MSVTGRFDLPKIDSTSARRCNWLSSKGYLANPTFKRNDP